MYLQIHPSEGNQQTAYSLVEAGVDGVIIPSLTAGQFAKKFLNLEDPEIMEEFSSGNLTDSWKNDHPNEHAELTSAINMVKTRNVGRELQEW